MGLADRRADRLGALLRSIGHVGGHDVLGGALAGVGSEHLLYYLVLAQVDRAFADGAEERTEDPVGGGVVLAKEGTGAAAQVLVDLGGIGMAASLGGLGERQDFGDLAVAERCRRPTRSAPSGAVDQRADGAAVGPLVELEQQVANHLA